MEFYVKTVVIPLSRTNYAALGASPEVCLGDDPDLTKPLVTGSQKRQITGQRRAGTQAVGPGAALRPASEMSGVIQGGRGGGKAPEQRDSMPEL
jgi:hypothetical protein